MASQRLRIKTLGNSIQCSRRPGTPILRGKHLDRSSTEAQSRALARTVKGQKLSASMNKACPTGGPADSKDTCSGMKQNRHRINKAVRA